MDDQVNEFQIRLTKTDLRLVRAALMLLEDTLGREEAEELEQVQAILARLPDVGPSE